MTPADRPAGTGTESGTESAAGTGTESGTATESGTESAAGTGTESGTATESGTESAAGTGTESGTATESGTESAAGTGTESGTATESGTESESGTATGAGTESGTGTGAGTESGTGTESAAGTNSAAGGDTESVAGGAADVGAGGAADVGAGRAADVGAGGAADVGAGRAADVGAGGAADVGAGRAADVGAGGAADVGAGDGPVVRFEGVGLTYPGPPPVQALRPCELTVERGEYVTVVGPSGSGKSTFLNVAGLIDAPTTGRYLLDGIDTGALRDRDRTALRGQRIGFVFQSFHLLPHRSALENVRLAMVYNGVPHAERADRARTALERVGLGHRTGHLPTRMSGGERQRVAIARALVAGPSLLLCDEPTGNLDTATAGAVLGLLDELHADGLTLLVITHDPHVAARGRRTVSIRDGILTEVVTA